MAKPFKVYYEITNVVRRFSEKGERMPTPSTIFFFFRLATFSKYPVSDWKKPNFFSETFLRSIPNITDARGYLENAPKTA